MRWIARMIDRIRDCLKSKTARRAEEALAAADHQEREIDRIADETHAGAERLRKALLKLETALQGKGR